MTVLQSLLSTFRRSRSHVRRMRRNPASGASSCEALESRLLLTNPDPFSSLPGAPVTIYLDFDGHIESDADWTLQRRDGLAGTAIDTPAFDANGDPAGFNQDERDRIQEIWARVAEDFAPFNINVTTVEPPAFRNAREVLVSVGGSGSWTVPASGNELPPRSRSLPGGFSNAGNPQTVFVFQQPHAGLGGGAAGFQQNIAVSISEAVAVSMGLEVHQIGNNVRLEGDALIGPILGDSIVGVDDLPANPLSERDIWFNAPGAGTVVQDDLAAIVNNPNVGYRADDHGNTDTSATGISIAVGVEMVNGVIERNTDVDVFSFTTAATNATITVEGINLTTAPFLATTPGSNLDPVITVRDASGTVLGTANNPGLRSSLSVSVPDGTYYVEVSNRGEYGNLGQYTLSLGGVDRLPQFANPVPLDSNPGAPVTFYLAFAGDNIAAANPILAQRVDGGNGDFAIPAYDEDGTVGFNSGEVDRITEIWARVAEDFRPFDVNVTTVRPGNLQDGVSAQVTVGGDGAFAGNIGYTALPGAFSDPAFPNIGYVFSENIQTGSPRDAQYIAYQASAAFGVMLGLGNHPLYTPSGNIASQFNPGTSEVGPIMGGPLTSLRDVWTNTAGPISVGILQDDLDIIDTQLDYRTDDHGDTVAGATTITVVAGDDVFGGVIETNTDVDVFRFNALATTATISVKGLDLATQFPGVPNPGSNLDPLLEILNSGGVVIASSDLPFIPGNNASLTASITQDLTAGTYYIRVSNRAEYGNLGEYTVTMENVDGNPVTIAFSPDVFSEIDGLQTGVGTVSRPAGQLFGAPIIVDLVSADPLEVTVPPSVTIPSNASSATFDVTIVDDNLLDGDQRVGITAVVDGVANSEAFITVTDYETVSVSLDPNPVGENAGTAQLTVARSNTDVGAPNHWVTVNNELREYDPSGALIRTVPVEWPANSGLRPVSEHVHDVTVMEDGRVAIFNGTANVYLSIFNPGTSAWNHIGPIAGLSGSGADLTAGGISSVGNYVFLSDLQLFPGDPHGLVRVDVTTGEIVRFGDRIVGARIFAMANPPLNAGRTVYEIDPTNGDLLNTLTLERPADALTFDGTFLWTVVRADFFTTFVDELHQVDPDTGAVLDVHPLTSLQNSQFEGLTYLNGLLYIVDNQGDFTFSLTVEAYDPATRLVAGSILAVELVNPDEVGSFLGALPSANRLLAASVFTNEIFEIDPGSGVITSRFTASQPYPFDGFFGTGPGVSSVSDVVIGGVTYDELIYVHSAPNEFDIYTRNGLVIDADPLLPGINPLRSEVAFSGDFSGEDVPGISASEPKFRDVSIGFDGRVYGLLESGDEIAVHDAETFARIDTIVLDRVVRTIAVADSSGIYAGTNDGNLILFDLNGVTQSIAASPLGLITDIEVNLGQEVLVSDAGGMILATTQAAIAAGDLSSASILEDAVGLSFVSFGRHNTRSTGNLVVTLQSDDLTELVVPATVTIPVDQQSITFDVTVVDDNERDGDQVVTVTADSPEYVSDSTVVIVTDVENVGVEVLPDEVVEGAGILPGVVRVFRTDIGGPLDFISKASAANTTSQPIIDNAVTISPINIPNQVARVTDVNVTLSIQHAAIPDLDVFLISPSGTRVELFTDLSSNESRLTNTTLDDQAAIRIVDAAAPFTGRFIPEQSLANFIGENPSGDWKLEVIDDSASVTGMLMNWSLEISTIGLSALNVTLGSSDPLEADVQVSVTIPVNQAEIFVPLEVFDDDLVDGTKTVIVSVDNVDANGFIWVNDSVDVTDSELLTLTVDKTRVSEGDGAGAIKGTLTRLDTVGDLTVSLFSSDTSELTVPPSVIIPDGQASVTFDIDAVDDPEFDGDQQVTISATASGYVPAVADVITVEDQEPRLSLSTLTPVVAEDAGTITFTVTRLDVGDLSVAQQVALTSSDTSELTVPAVVIIPPGEFSASFPATVVADTELDGPQTAIVTASDFNTVNPGINAASFSVTVEDAEFVAITVPAGSESILENAGAGAITATVSVSSLGHTVPIIVALTNSDLTELSIPSQVVIPVDETSVTFRIDVLNDPKIDRDQLVNIVGHVDGYRDGVLQITVRDHEPPTPVGPAFDVVSPTPTILWAAVDGATRYDLWVNDVSRNINQLFRLENLPGRDPLFSETFESGQFDETKWTSTNAEVDGLGLNTNGNFSAHLNGNPDGGDRLESATVDLSGEIGAQLTYSFQRTGSLDPPSAGQDLILSYRNAAGAWIQLQRQLGVGDDMTVFQAVVVNLPTAALHPDFAFRFETIGDPGVEDAGATVDDWFIDDVEISGYEKFKPTQELGVGTYRFWVRAYDSLEQPGFWSGSRTFRVRTAPVFTSPIRNSGVAETSFPQFNWTSVVDTDRYDLWVNNVTTGEAQVVRRSDLQTTSFASATANLPGGTYKAWVRAIGPDGFFGNWSSPTEFTVLTTPTGISPSGSTFDRTPEIRWNAVEGATNYDVWVTQRNPNQQARVVLRDRFVSGTTRVPETDFEDGRYVIWVRAIAADGSKSPWSDPVEFVIGGRPTVTSPTIGSSTSATPVIAWTGINQADHYEIWINNSAGNQVLFNDNVKGTSFAVPTPLAADNYRVWVRAISTMGEASFWSFPVNFTVVAAGASRQFDGSPSAPVELIPAGMEAARFVSLPVEARVVAELSDEDPEVNELPIDALPQLDNSSRSDDLEVDVTSAVDSVMAAWDGADWWSVDNPERSTEAPSMAATALGVLASGTALKRTNRRRDSDGR